MTTEDGLVQPGVQTGQPLLLSLLRTDGGSRAEGEREGVDTALFTLGISYWDPLPLEYDQHRLGLFSSLLSVRGQRTILLGIKTIVF